MTLLLIGQKVWSYRLVTLPILALVLIGAFYTVAIKKPVYTTSASYILVSPPAPPTPDQIARDPKLAIGASNPYTRFSDQSIVVQILAARVGSQQARQRLAAQGADNRYTVAPDVSFGFTAPIVQITGTGNSPAEAIKTANLVGQALTGLLGQMQAAQGVAPHYRINSQVLVGARHATEKASGKLRGLVAVLALGGVLLFLVTSALDAVAILRRREAGPDLSGEDISTGALSGTPSPPRSSGGARVEPEVVRKPSGRRAAARSVSPPPTPQAESMTGLQAESMTGLRQPSRAGAAGDG